MSENENHNETSDWAANWLQNSDYGAQNERDPHWWRSQRKVWDTVPGPDNPEVRVVRGYDKVEREFRWWLEPCPEYVDPMDHCPGYLVEHVGPLGATIKHRECPDHGFRWERPLSPKETLEDLRLRRSAALLPPAVAGWRFETFPDKTSRALATVREYARAGRLTQNLLLLGNYGTGKTGLAVSALKERVEAHGERALFVVVPDLFAEVRASFSGDGHSSLLERVRSVHLLVLDDLGAEKGSEWVREQLYTIINGRLMSQHPTIVTTNLMPAALADAVGERSAERLKAYRPVVVGGENLRNGGA